MKKIILFVALLLGTATTFAQGYSAPVRVVIQNRTAYNIYCGTRFHVAFFDGANDTTYWGVNSNQLFAPNANTFPYLDFTYQPEVNFEPALPPGQIRTYMNTTQPGYAFQTNSTYSSFITNTGTYMNGFQNNPNFFYKYMRLDWIRFLVSASTAANYFTGGQIAHPVPAGFSQINTNPNVFTGNYSEMVIPFVSSTTSVTGNGVTINAVWTATTYVPGQVQTVNIVFY